MQQAVSIWHGVPPITQPLNAYRPPGIVPSFTPEASLWHENPVTM